MAKLLLFGVCLYKAPWKLKPTVLWSDDVVWCGVICVVVCGVVLLFPHPQPTLQILILQANIKTHNPEYPVHPPSLI